MDVYRASRVLRYVEERTKHLPEEQRLALVSLVEKKAGLSVAGMDQKADVESRVKEHLRRITGGDVWDLNPAKRAEKGLVLKDLRGKPNAATPSAEYDPRGLSSELVRSATAELKGNTLSLAGEPFDLTDAQKKEMVLLKPNAQMASAVWAGVKSGQPTLAVVESGSGASHTARWTLTATQTPFEYHRINASTSLDDLASSLRPDETGSLRVVLGKLAKCAEEGKVFVADGVERADPKLLAAFRTLAGGAKTFDDPVTGEPIPVRKGFNLILIAQTDGGRRLPADLAAAQNTVHIPAYSEDDHATLLREVHHLSAEDARLAAATHEAIRQEPAFDFGTGFTLDWSLLDRVGQRLGGKIAPPNSELRGAFAALYGARLSQPDQVAAFEKAVRPPPIPVTRSREPGFVHNESVDRTLGLAQQALEAKEVVLLHGAGGQTGATRLVQELSARRNQPLVTVVGSRGLDAHALEQAIVFDEKGDMRLKPGVVSDALINGKLLYIDHADYLNPQTQSALFALGRQTTFTTLEKGQVVEVPVNPARRIVLSMTGGTEAGPRPPSPRDRASTTEISVRRPTAEQLKEYIPKDVPPALKLQVTEVAARVARLAPDSGIFKLQRFIDFCNASKLLSQYMPRDEAVGRAARMVFDDVPADLMEKAAPVTGRVSNKDPRPIWMQILDLTPEQVKRRIATTPYRLGPSVERDLEVCAVAHALGRDAAFALGPAGSGKTVLGELFGALLRTEVRRMNFTASTEAQQMLGRLGPTREGAETRFKVIDGATMKAAQKGKGVVILDELNLNRDAQLAVKGGIDSRRTLFDAENQRTQGMGDVFVLATGNLTDAKTGRLAPVAAVWDNMFHLRVDAKPEAELIKDVQSQSTLKPALVETLVRCTAELQNHIALANLKSKVAPITTTASDMLKPIRVAEHLFERDGVGDREEQRRILGREVYRWMRGLVLDAGEREDLLQIIRQHFGDDVQPPERPTEMRRTYANVDGKRVQVLRLGEAQYPIRATSKDPEVRALVPTETRQPVGKQYEFLEDFFLALETGQPVSLVGKPGAGKTMLAQAAAAAVNEPYHEQSFHARMTQEDLTGNHVIDDKGGMTFRYSPGARAARQGGWWGMEEYLTAPNGVREGNLPVLEGKQMQIPQTGETLTRDQWHPSFRQVILTNGGDIRSDNFSDAEARRTRIIGVPELDEKDELLTIAVRDYKGLDAKEAEACAVFFHQAMALQRANPEVKTRTPLSARVFGNFMNAYAELRKKLPAPDAADRAARLVMSRKLGDLAPDLNKSIAKLFGKPAGIAQAGVPERTAQGMRYGETIIPPGADKAWDIDHRRFPITEARASDLGQLAEAFSSRAPMTLPDDESGESLELIREFGRQNGIPVTVVTFPKQADADIDAHIEKLALTERGFAPERQKIAQAVEHGHILVLRGVGNVDNRESERLNSLGDGRRWIELPSGKIVKAGDSTFRAVYLQDPQAPHPLSEPVQNRVVEPILSVEGDSEARVRNFASILRANADVSESAAISLAAFHIYLNNLLRRGTFRSGAEVGSFLNRDATAIAHRLSELRVPAAEEPAALHQLVNMVYGEAFGVEADRDLLDKLAKKAFGSDGAPLQLSDTPNASRQMVRFGKWAVSRDPRPNRPGVPAAESPLPQTATLSSVRQRLYAAAHFDEPVLLTGSSWMTTAEVEAIARTRNSPLYVVEGHPDLPESQLMGGLVLDKATNKLVFNEGKAWRAQKDGGTLFVRNASRLPPSVITALAEIAASGRIERVKDGKLESQPRAFQLILQTSPGDPPLPPELASLATRVRCPQISDGDELKEVLSHVLIGVPGGDELAAQLPRFADLDEALQDDTASGALTLHFDSDRAVMAATQIARQVKEGGASLNEAVADVLTRFYERPVQDLPVAKAVRGEVDHLIKALGAGGEILRAREPEGFDLQNKPELAGLKQDFDRAFPTLASALSRTAAEAVRTSDPADAVDLLRALTENKVLPDRADAQARAALSRLAAKGEEPVAAPAPRPAAPPPEPPRVAPSAPVDVPASVKEVVGVLQSDRTGDDKAWQLVRKLDNRPVPPFGPLLGELVKLREGRSGSVLETSSSKDEARLVRAVARAYPGEQAAVLLGVLMRVDPLAVDSAFVGGSPQAAVLAGVAEGLGGLDGRRLAFALGDVLRDPQRPDYSLLSLRVALARGDVLSAAQRDRLTSGYAKARPTMEEVWADQGRKDPAGVARAFSECGGMSPPDSVGRSRFEEFLAARVADGSLSKKDLAAATPPPAAAHGRGAVAAPAADEGPARPRPQFVVGPAEAHALLGKLAGELTRAEGDGAVGRSALKFLQGARLWDLDQRLEVLDTYAALFERAGAAGAGPLAELKQARTRFDQAGTVERLTAARKSVVSALDAYRTRAGESDDQLSALRRTLLERWDAVATAPLFQEHEVLREELQSLEQTLTRLSEAHQKRGEAPAEAAALIDALHGAGRTLEALRMAEQSAVLHQGMARTSRDTGQLLQSLTEGSEEVHRLEGARSRHEELTRAQGLLDGLRDDLLGLNVHRPEMERPAGASDAELTARATAEMTTQLAPAVEVFRQRRLAELQAEQPSLTPGRFFSQYDLSEGDFGLSLKPSEPKASAVEKAIERLPQDVEQFRTELLEKNKDRITARAADLKRADDQRIDEIMKSRIVDAAETSAAQFYRTARDVAAGLAAAQRALTPKDAALTAEIADVQRQLNDAPGTVQTWISEVRREAFGNARKFLSIFVKSLRETKMDPPDWKVLQTRTQEVLERLKANGQAQMKGLPEFGRIDEQRALNAQAIQELMSASSLGDLAAKYAAVMRARTEAPADLQRVLSGVVSRMADGHSAEDLLSTTAAFCRSADLLSTEVALKSGVNYRVAPAVEAIVQAAEIVHALELTKPNYRAADRALSIAQDKLAELFPPGQDAPMWATAIRDDMTSLRKALGGAGGDVLQVDAGAVHDMLSALALQDANEARAAVTGNLVTGEAGPTRDGPHRLGDQDTVRHLESAYQQVRQPEAELGLEDLAPRKAQVRVLELSFDPPSPRTGRNLDGAKPPDDTAEQREHRADVKDSAKSVAKMAERASGDLPKAQQALIESLDKLENSVRKEALQGLRADLSTVGEQLEPLALGTPGRGTAVKVSQALRALSAAAQSLRALESVPIDVSSKLLGAVDGGKALGASFDSERLGELARTWAADALVATRTVQRKLADLSAKADEKSSKGRAVESALEALSQEVGELTESPRRLGAFSRLTLLAHARSRLSALAPALPEAERESAQELIAKLVEAAQGIPELTGGEGGQRALAEAYASYQTLGAGLREANLDPKQVSHYRELGNLLGEIMSAERGTPLDQDAERISSALTEARTLARGTSSAAKRSSSELQIRLGTLRAQLVDFRLSGLQARWRTLTTDYLKAVRERHLALSQAASRFLEGAPDSAEAAEQLAVDLKAEISAASKGLQGPGAVVLAQDLRTLKAGLEKVVAGKDPRSAVARQFLKELAPMAEGAEALASYPDAPERFARLIDHVSGEMAQASKRGADSGFVKWSQAASDELQQLLQSNRVEMPGLLRAMEDRLLPKPPEAAGADVSDDGGRPAVTIQGVLDRVQDAGLDEAQPVAVRAAAMEAVLGQMDETGGQGMGAELAAAAPGEKGVGTRGVARAMAAPVNSAARSEDADRLRIVDVPDAQVKKVRAEMDKVAAADRARALTEKPAAKNLNPYQAQKVANEEYIRQMSDLMRQHGISEGVVINDLSGSANDPYGGSTKVAQEQAVQGILLGAFQRAEGNAAAVTFGGNLPDQYLVHTHRNVQVHLVKKMSEPLNDDTANQAFTLSGHGSGGTDLQGSIEVGMGQFTNSRSRKLLWINTDAELNHGEQQIIRDLIQRVGKDVVVVMSVFGSAQNAQYVAGEFGQSFASFKDAITGAPKLLERAVVANDRIFQGKVTAAAKGIGTSLSQDPLSAAPSDGPMTSSLEIGRPLPRLEGNGDVSVGTGPRRALRNLADRATYNRALKALMEKQQAVRQTPMFRRLLQEVRELKRRHDEENITNRLRDQLASTMPTKGGTQWLRRQPPGPPFFDERELPKYELGRKQGVPVVNVFKKPLGSDSVRPDVVLVMDESTSMGDGPKMRAHVEALLAYGDALKAQNPDTRIAVIGISDKVRLHAGFEQPWNDELKAQLLHQLQGHYPATDDERGTMEARQLLRLAGSEVGMIAGFGDGQGAPGMRAVMDEAAREGVGVLWHGLGADSMAVTAQGPDGSRVFGEHGVWGDHLPSLVDQVGTAWGKVWEGTGRRE